MKTPKLTHRRLFIAAFLIFAPMQAYAMPWDNSLKQFVDNLSGPTAIGIATLVFVIFGLMVAFGEVRGIMGRLLQIGLGLSFALMATSWVQTFSSGGTF